MCGSTVFGTEENLDEGRFWLWGTEEPYSLILMHLCMKLMVDLSVDVKGSGISFYLEKVHNFPPINAG